MKRFKVKVDSETSKNIEENIWKLEWPDQQKLIADAIADSIDRNSIEAFQTKHEAGFLYFAVKDNTDTRLYINLIKVEDVENIEVD